VPPPPFQFIKVKNNDKYRARPFPLPPGITPNGVLKEDDQSFLSNNPLIISWINPSPRGRKFPG